MMVKKEEAHPSVAAHEGGQGTASARTDDNMLDQKTVELLSRAENFLAANAHLVAELDDAAARAIATGTPFSVSEMWERWRWHDRVTSDGRSFALDNSLRPAVARIVRERHPDLGDLLRVRRSRFDAAFEVRAAGNA